MDKETIYENISLLYEQAEYEDELTGRINSYRWEMGLGVFGTLYSDCVKTYEEFERQTGIDVKGTLWGYPVDVNPSAPFDTLKLWKEIK